MTEAQELGGGAVEMPAAVPHAQTPGLLYCCAHPRKPEPPWGQLKSMSLYFKFQDKILEKGGPQSSPQLLEKPSSHLVTVKQRKYKEQPGKLSTRGSYISEGVQHSAPSVMVICEGNKSMNISESLLDYKVNIDGQTYGKVISILYINSK